MKNTFFHSILRYVHSQHLGEVLNVGILLVFPSKRRVIFKAAPDLKRIVHAYPSQSKKHLERYFIAFGDIVRRLNKNWSLDAEQLALQPQKFIHQLFLVEDASALQFSGPNISTLYDDDLEKIARYYQGLFVPASPKDENPPLRHDESYIKKRFDTLIKSFRPEVLKKIDSNKERLLVDNATTSLQFDFAWQNGHYNMVKAVSFDLQSATGINDKALTYFGKVTMLAEVADQQGLQFDFLMSKPQDKDFFKEYDKAISILGKAPQTIFNPIEEEDWEAYSQKTVEEAI